MLKYIMLLVIVLSTFSVFAQPKPAYQIFNAKGKKVTYSKMVKSLRKKDVILFGEIHDNPIDHWLQLELVQEFFGERNLILGLEMFESDNQEQLNLYIRGEVEDIQTDTSLRLWGNYQTDYAPLVDFAKNHGISVIATNVPAQYAKDVYRYGFSALEGLDESALSLMAPQPMPFDPDLKTYQDILTMMEHHGTPELVMAQALRDATMAHFIMKNYRPGSLLIHINGTYHSEYQEGILWYLKKSNAPLSYATIATTEQKTVTKLDAENVGKADYIICVDEDMTSTH